MFGAITGGRCFGRNLAAHHACLISANEVECPIRPLSSDLSKYSRQTYSVCLSCISMRRPVCSASDLFGALETSKECNQTFVIDLQPFLGVESASHVQSQHSWNLLSHSSESTSHVQSQHSWNLLSHSSESASHVQSQRCSSCVVDIKKWRQSTDASVILMI